ncbi:MAG: pyruvate dehydrogenase component [Verrucomicrobiota bacterium]|jgi:pyruvate dehydrogenase E2 component (dihydrolipoamide acetyltransferase)
MSVTLIKLPSLSPTMDKGTIATWKIKEGDFVKNGQVIAAIATDKSTVDYESMEEGYVRKIVLAAGTEALVNDVCAVLTDAKDEAFEAALEAALAKQKAAAAPAPAASAAAAPAAEAAAAPKAAPAAGSTLSVGLVPVALPPKKVAAPLGFKAENANFKASPAARKVAADKNINLAKVEPKTTGERIVLEDLKDLPHGYGQNEAQKGGGLVGYVARSEEPVKKIALGQMRKAIADRMVQASTAVPVIYVTTPVEMDRLIDLRKQLNSIEGMKISINDFVVKAVALALRAHPAVNAAFQGDHIAQFNDVDVSVAVSIPDGLITPIVRSADQKGLAAISAEVKSLAAKAKAGKLSLEEYQGGSFTISNLGMFGAVETFTAILNPPQAAILAVAGTMPEVRLVNGQVKEVQVCRLTITCDHRVIDGALAAEFLATLKGLLESPVKLVL